ncbi:cell wall hydrolase [Allopontixanthobacter sp.]|uniref:cell wall hydrolase n=1 Tax=Allopontixanthobacter sp. TaxID=2906452 RepID=UPI002AB923EA|nr:cell wall hydrolase [Allopontixanthobacter sp.]MDZ4308492.1 cell wall hydrolase [Allopontixanthobacter sp.]
MSRKAQFAGLIAIAATGTVVFASASAASSSAIAQQGESAEISALPLTDETVPVFVSEEVVQPLPAEPASEGAPQASSLKQLISAVHAPDALSPEMECLAGAVYFESRGEPVDGQLAVAQVVVNRAESRQFPSSYCGVVYQRSQFSFIKGGAMPHIKRSSAAWTRAKTIARIAHEGMWDSEVGDSLYFHANYVRPKWSRTKIARATIDSHIFYR